MFGPVPPLEPLASLALTTLGLGLQGVGLSMSYLGRQTLNMTQRDQISLKLCSRLSAADEGVRVRSGGHH